MKTAEIFGKIISHQVEGMMLHDQMATAFDFLALPGFKHMHEYRYEEESAEMRRVVGYFINHFNMLPDEGHPQDPHVVPKSWAGYTRQQVSMDTRRKAVRDLVEHWVRWERETKSCYQKAYTELMECGEVAAGQFVKKLICDVDDELAKAEEMNLRLEGVMYDMPTIEQMQDAYGKSPFW